MVQAFGEALDELATLKGNYSESAWEWGSIHTRYDPNLFGLPSLDGPTLAAAGDDNTPNAAYGLNSTTGPRLEAGVGHGTTAELFFWNLSRRS